MKFFIFIITTSFLATSVRTIFLSKINPDSLCKQWFENEPDPTPIINALPPCWTKIPLTEEKNFPNKFGSFKIDSSCNPNKPTNCYILHRGAKTCYRSIENFNGAGQQCCYSDKFELLVGFPGGGTLDLAHSDDPIKHFKIDVYPYFLCCKLSNNCNLYYEKRPSDDGSRWQENFNKTF
jgi:hypothetical protein